MSNQASSVGDVMSSLQPTVTIPLSHGEGHTTSLSSTVIVAITETPASEAPDIGAPIVSVVFDSGWNDIELVLIISICLFLASWHFQKFFNFQSHFSI